MTPTEATIVLAFRANVSMEAIAANMNVSLQTVEDAVIANPARKVRTDDVLLFVNPGKA